MRRAVLGLSVLSLDEEAEFLANEYIRYGAVPKGFPRDALHIAIAVVNGTDFMVSWNFKHIVRRKTREVVRMVNAVYGYRYIEITSPPEVIGEE